MATPPHDPSSVVHLDAAQLKALAQPLRMRLLGLLRREGPATASALARRFGTNSGQTSYHLRQLAEAGLVEDDPDHADGRERWWRAAHESTSWSSAEFADDPDAKAADAWLLGHLIRRHGASLGAWLEERDQLTPAWSAGSELSDLWLVIGPTRLQAMVAEVHAVFERYRGEAPDTDPEAREVTIHLHAFPTAESDR